MTDCIHCENPAEVCRGCYERLRQEANDRANERIDSQYVALVRQQALTASVTERLLLAERERDRWREASQLRYQERDRLREEVYHLRSQQARLREAARAITDACAIVPPMTHLDHDVLCYLRIGSVRALAKALEETSPTQPPSE